LKGTICINCEDHTQHVSTVWQIHGGALSATRVAGFTPGGIALGTAR